MENFYAFLILSTMVAGGYYFIRIVIALIRGKEKKPYIKKLIGSVILFVIACVVHAPTEESPQTQTAITSTTTPVNQETKQAPAKKDDTDLSNLSDEELTNQVIEYIKNNPSERIFLTNYALNISTINPSFEMSEKHREAEIMLNSIPIVGGMINDKGYEMYLENCRKFFTNEINDYDYIKKAAEKYHDPDSQSYAFPGMKPEKISDKVYNKFLEENIPQKLSSETVKAMNQIAELKYRYIEAYVDDNRERMSSKPDVLDFVDELSYNVFYKEENEQKQKSAKESLKKIYSELWLDGLYYDKQHLQWYYEGKVPKWIFAYELEPTYLPNDENDFTGGSENSIERIYSMINGNWHSLKTGENVEFNIKLEDHGKTSGVRLSANQVNGVYFLSNTASYTYVRVC